MSFDTDRAEFTQEHFIVVELDLPWITDECALSDGTGTGYGTPLTCTQSWNEQDFKTIYLATQNTPLEYGRPRTSSGLPADVIEFPDNVYRVIRSISEDPAEIKPGQGLAARLRLRVQLKDFKGNPGPREGAYESAEGTRTIVVGDRVVVSQSHTNPGTIGNVYVSMSKTGSVDLSVEDYDTQPSQWEDLGVFAPKETGTFFGKLAVRSVVTNKAVRVKYFYVQADGVYAESDAQLRSYTAQSLRNNGDGTYSLEAADELVKIDGDKSQFPEPTGGTIRGAVNSTTANVTVDNTTDWEQFPRPYIVRAGEELMKVNSVTDNQGVNARLVVSTRGSDISFTNFITTTTNEAHDDGDEVQICHTDDDEDIAFMFAQVLNCAGLAGGMYGSAEGVVDLEIGDTVEVSEGHVNPGTIGNAYFNNVLSGSTDLSVQDYDTQPSPWTDLGVRKWDIAQWKAETAAWLAGVTIDNVWHVPQAANDVLFRLLTNYLLDMWYDPIDALIKISAISVWKESSITLRVGEHINRNTLKISELDNKRSTAAFVHFNKPSKIEDDEIKHYKEIAVNANLNLESAGQYGQRKTKQFPNSAVIDTLRAELLVQRWVSRFGDMPLLYRWSTEEKFLDFKTGDVVDIVGDELQNFDGSTRTVRAQVLSVRPRWTATGRTYNVRAMTYEPAFTDGEDFTITGPANNVNLFIQAGAPAAAVTITFLLDGGIFGSTSIGEAAIVAGAFPSGSHIDLVLQNGADLQAHGGNGGKGGDVAFIPFPGPGWFPTEAGAPGEDAGIVYDAQGIDTDIYLSKTFAGNAADGTLRAPGGGGGGEIGAISVAGDGGGGGAGSNVGPGGPGGIPDPGDGSGGAGTPGVDGDNGTTTGDGGPAVASAGDGGDWGEDGAAAGAGGGVGGTAGAGIEDGGATVNLLVATYFLSSSGVQSIVPGDSVEVAAGHVAGGVVGDVYESLITDGARDLANEDYSVGANWSKQYAEGSGDTPNNISA